MASVFFNDYQYRDLLDRFSDLYANTKYEIISNFLKSRPALKILNAGCGSGELSFLLAALGHEVVGIDPATEYIELAKKNLPDALRERCQFFISTIENYYSAERFDAIVSTDVLEHIENDRKAVVKLAGLLKVGGDLIITVPALPCLFGYHDELLGHYRRYTKAGLRQLLGDGLGLNIKEFRYFGFSLLPVSYLYSRLFRKRYPQGIQDAGPLSSVRRILLRLMLIFDKHVPMPIGTSIICWSQLSVSSLSDD